MSDLFNAFGETYLYGPGREGKFTALFPWDVLNTALRQHRLTHPRLRVFKDGKLVPSSEYSTVSVGRKDHSTTPRLMPGELIAQLQNGATLVVDAVDEIYEPLTTLAASLERELGEKIQVNLYAGWHAEPGFDVHWDGHDVIVLQLTGRKAWAIYGETRKHPLADDVVKDAAPTGEPIWAQTIKDGDLLYIPRGFWHVAKPLDEASLHLTIGIPNRTGIDLMTWFARRLRTSEVLRKDLPKFKCKEERDAHLDALFHTVREQLNQQLMEDFLDDHDGNAIPRLSIDLPEVAARSSVRDLLGKRFVLTTPRDLRLKAEGDLVVTRANRKIFRFKISARPLLEFLNKRQPATVEELVDLSRGLDANTVTAFVTELLTYGLVAVVSDSKLT
ncbi:MAG TPA: cupin domain-containing protein [Pyrinomonadaceae bacterium]|nr:cupin domain-containing protein [Pyrinomonadaceae bacterium]